MDIKIQPVENNPSITSIAISGRIDNYTIGRIEEEIGSLLNIGTNKLICDLSAVEFVSGAGLKTFLKSIKQARKQGGDFKLCTLQPAVEKLFNLAGFSKVAQIFPTTTEAVCSFTGTPVPQSPSTAQQDIAYAQTIMPGMADPYGQTMIPTPDKSKGDKDIAYMQTLVEQPAPKDQAYDKTFIEPDNSSSMNYQQTLLEKPTDIGYQPTMIEGTPGESTLVDNEAESFARDRASGQDPMAELRLKLELASTGKTQIPDTAVPKNAAKTEVKQPTPEKDSETAYQTVMDNIETIVGTLIVPGEPSSEPAIEPNQPTPPAGQPETVPSQLAPTVLNEFSAGISPIIIRMPLKAHIIEPISHIFGATGAIAHISKMSLIKTGVAVVEILKAIAKTVPDNTNLDARIVSAPGEISITIRTDQPYSIYDILRPQLDTSVDTAEKAKAWLNNMASSIELDPKNNSITITKTK